MRAVAPTGSRTGRSQTPSGSSANSDPAQGITTAEPSKRPARRSSSANSASLNR